MMRKAESRQDFGGLSHIVLLLSTSLSLHRQYFLCLTAIASLDQSINHGSFTVCPAMALLSSHGPRNPLLLPPG